MLLDDFTSLPRVRTGLFDQALYQILRASLEIQDMAGANEAMRKILKFYPRSEFADRSLLLVGQNLTVAGNPEDARGIFGEFARRIANSRLLPEVELALVRTYVEEQDWTAAIGKYEEWADRFPTNELRARAEFYRAWAYSQARLETNALALFTNFVVQFPTNELAPQAQYWVASFYYNQNDFVNAQKTFQSIFENTNWPATSLSYQARMMAGRAAMAGQRWTDAAGKSGHFTLLVNDDTCPTNLMAEAFFALGDTFTLWPADPDKPRLQRFEEAIKTFNKIPQMDPASPLVPLAWGRIGDCYFQLGAQESKNYDNATNAYQKVLVPSAPVTARSKAEVGIGLVLEKLARSKSAPENVSLLKAARDHYLIVLYGTNLNGSEKPDPFWLREAGFAAVRLAEEQNEWDIAIKIYNRMLAMLPPLRTALEKRIERASEQLRPEIN